MEFLKRDRLLPEEGVKWEEVEKGVAETREEEGGGAGPWAESQSRLQHSRLIRINFSSFVLERGLQVHCLVTYLFGLS